MFRSGNPPSILRCRALQHYPRIAMSAFGDPAPWYGVSIHNSPCSALNFRKRQTAMLLYTNAFERDFLDEGLLSSCLDLHENSQTQGSLRPQLSLSRQKSTTSEPGPNYQGRAMCASTEVLPTPASWASLPTIPDLELPVLREDSSPGLSPALRPLMV